jgi:hypothetical protein
MEEVRFREVAHDTGNMSKHVESSLDMARRDFGIAQRSIQVVIPPRVLLVRRDIISKFVVWTLAPKTDMPLEMM